MKPIGRFVMVLAALSGLGLALRIRVPGPIRGRVWDDHGPVAGATVRQRATDHSTQTDATGRFELAEFEAAPLVHLTAWRDGYYIGGARVRPWSPEPVIRLNSIAERDNAQYDWLLPVIPHRGAVEGRLIDSGLDVAAWLSFNRLFLPLAGRLELGCQDCHGEAFVQEWQDSRHGLGTGNPVFMTVYNGQDVAGRQSPPTEFAVAQDYGRVPLPARQGPEYFGPGYLLDFPGTAGNCAACHLPGAAADQPYGTSPNEVAGVDSSGIHCDYCHKVRAVTLDPATGLPPENLPGVLSTTLNRPAPEPQVFFGPYDDVDVGPDTHSPLYAQSEYCAPCHTASFWGVPIYQSFAEWRASSYSEQGKVCQDCHMEPDGATTNFAPGRGGVERDPLTIASHGFPGGDSQELVQEAAALTVSAQVVGGRLQVTARVENTGTGHSLPTDSPMRQVLLVVRAAANDGEALTLLEGETLPDWAGDLAGLPGQYYAKLLEQLWTNDFPSISYWTPTRIREDTRLTADELRESHFTFEVPQAGAVDLDVRLIYRRAFFQLARWKGWDLPDILMQSFSQTLVAPSSPSP